MRRTLTILVLVALETLSAAGCAGGDTNAGPAGAGPATAAPATTVAPDGDPAGAGGGRGGYGDRSEPTSSSGSGDGDTDDVRIEGFAFAPKTVTAKVGQKVKWEHQDAGVTHTVTADDGGFDSKELEEGDEFSNLFRVAGTFAYHCAIHRDMRGTVKVAG